MPLEAHAAGANEAFINSHVEARAGHRVLLWWPDMYELSGTTFIPNINDISDLYLANGIQCDLVTQWSDWPLNSERSINGYSLILCILPFSDPSWWGKAKAGPPLFSGRVAFVFDWYAQGTQPWDSAVQWHNASYNDAWQYTDVRILGGVDNVTAEHPEYRDGQPMSHQLSEGLYALWHDLTAYCTHYYVDSVTRASAVFSTVERVTDPAHPTGVWYVGAGKGVMVSSRVYNGVDWVTICDGNVFTSPELETNTQFLLNLARKPIQSPGG